MCSERDRKAECALELPEQPAGKLIVLVLEVVGLAAEEVPEIGADQQVIDELELDARAVIGAVVPGLPRGPEILVSSQ